LPLEAETTLGNYLEVRVPYEISEVTDQEVEKALQNLQENQAIVEPVDRPAQEGDRLQVLISGIRKQVTSDQDSTLINERSIPVIIEKPDADTSDEWPFPGFSRQLIDLSADDEKQISYKYSEDSPFETLRGVDADFHIKVERVSIRKLPELNDEFAQSIEEFESLKQLRTEVRANLEHQQKETYEQAYNDQILNKILETATLKYPPQMIEDEVQDLIDRLKNRLEQQGLNLDTYLKMRKLSLEDLKNEMRATAEENIRRSLILFRIADNEHIEVSTEDAQEEANHTITRLSELLPEDQLKRLSSEKMVNSLIRNIMVDRVIQKTQERLRNIAQGIYDGKQENSKVDESGKNEEHVENGSNKNE
jgi:trigger factor